MLVHRHTSAGFTLVELAIVLVIVGLLLGGIFKGQALIDNARVRSMASQVDGIRSAWYAFEDRYRAVPGDFPLAAVQIHENATNGNGNGMIDDANERLAVWQQLTLAGFIDGNFNGGDVGTAADVACSSEACPRNPYAGYYKFSHGAQAAESTDAAHELFTGDRVPVGILAELDRKIDDGLANQGRLRVHRAFVGACTSGAQWNVAAGSRNCAGVLRE